MRGTRPRVRLRWETWRSAAWLAVAGYKVDGWTMDQLTSESCSRQSEITRKLARVYSAGGSAVGNVHKSSSLVTVMFSPYACSGGAKWLAGCTESTTFKARGAAGAAQACVVVVVIRGIGGIGGVSGRDDGMGQRQVHQSQVGRARCPSCDQLSERKRVGLIVVAVKSGVDCNMTLTLFDPFDFVGT